MAIWVCSKSGTNFRQRVKSRFVVVDAGSGSVNSDQQRRRRSLVGRRAAQLDMRLVVLGSRVSNDGVARWSDGATQLAARLVILFLRTAHCFFSYLALVPRRKCFE
ncbi:hypothetical protein ACFX2G_044570 [Malus domestica]